jgi:hypothetical protein
MLCVYVDSSSVCERKRHPFCVWFSECQTVQYSHSLLFTSPFIVLFRSEPLTNFLRTCFEDTPGGQLCVESEKIKFYTTRPHLPLLPRCLPTSSGQGSLANLAPGNQHCRGFSHIHRVCRSHSQYASFQCCTVQGQPTHGSVGSRNLLPVACVLPRRRRSMRLTSRFFSRQSPISQPHTSRYRYPPSFSNTPTRTFSSLVRIRPRLKSHETGTRQIHTPFILDPHMLVPGRFFQRCMATSLFNFYSISLDVRFPLILARSF